jgi:hypothetical protein
MSYDNQDLPFEGERLKEQGMERANGAVRVQDWKEKANQVFEFLSIGTEFTSDTAVRHIGPPDSGANKCNVVGAWISGLSKSGRVRFTGQFRKSKRAARHAGLQRIWKKIK